MSGDVTFIMGGQKYVLSSQELRKSKYLSQLADVGNKNIIELPQNMVSEQLFNFLMGRPFTPSLALYVEAKQPHDIDDAQKILDMIVVPPSEFVKFVQDFRTLNYGYSSEENEIIAKKIQGYIDLSALGPDAERAIRLAPTCDYYGSPDIDLIVSQLKEKSKYEGGTFKSTNNYIFVISRSVNGPVLFCDVAGYGPIDAFLRHRRRMKSDFTQGILFMQDRFDDGYSKEQYDRISPGERDYIELPNVILRSNERLISSGISGTFMTGEADQWLSPNFVIIEDKRPNLIEMDTLSWYAVGYGSVLDGKYPRWADVLMGKNLSHYINTSFGPEPSSGKLKILPGIFFNQLRPAHDIKTNIQDTLLRILQPDSPSKISMPPSPPRVTTMRGPVIMPPPQTSAQPIFPMPSPQSPPRPMIHMRPAGASIFPVQTAAAPIFPVRSSAAPIFPMRSSAAPIFPVASVQPTAKPIFPVQSSSGPIFPMPSAKPIFPVQSSVQPSATPIFPVHPSATPIFPVQSSAKPIFPMPSARPSQ